MTTKQEAAAQVREAKARLGLTWAQLAGRLGGWAAGRTAMSLKD